MTDTVSKAKRSKNMAAIHSKDTEPELYIRKLLYAEGYRYRIASKKIPGKPDVYLRKYDTAIFINGCFWHHHMGCKYATTPKSNIEYWQNKFEINVKRDMHVKQELEAIGIRQLIIWECTVKKMKKSIEDREAVLKKIIEFISSEEQYLEL